jgi:hypothetical protein
MGRQTKNGAFLHPLRCLIFVSLWIQMTAIRMVLDTVEKLPDDASFEDIARRLEVVAAIQKGLDSLDRGEGKSIEDVEKLIASWTINKKGEAFASPL